MTSRASIAGPNTWILETLVSYLTDTGELLPCPMQLAYITQIIQAHANSNMDNTAKILHFALGVHHGELDDSDEMTMPPHMHIVLNATASYSDDILDSPLLAALDEPSYGTGLINIARMEMPDNGDVITEDNYAVFSAMATLHCKTTTGLTDEDMKDHFIIGHHPDLYTPSGITPH